MVVDIVIKNKIINYRNYAMEPELIAEKLDITIDEVCNILNYPLDPKLMIKQHRDFLFYDHGFGEHIGSRFDRYGLFLEDGDFEKWQPVCYMNKDGDEFKNLKNEAEKIKLTKNPVKEARRLWIMLRFEIYQCDNYKLLVKEFARFLLQIPDGKN